MLSDGLGVMLLLPVVKFCLVAGTAKIGGFLLYVCLRVSDRLVVDTRSNLSHTKFQDAGGLEIANVIVQVLSKEALN